MFNKSIMHMVQNILIWTIEDNAQFKTVEEGESLFIWSFEEKKENEENEENHYLSDCLKKMRKINYLSESAS